MFHTETRLTGNKIKIGSFQPYAVYPIVSEGLFKMSTGMGWPIGYVIKKGYTDASSGNITYELTSKISFRYRGIIHSSLTRHDINAALARIFTQHANKQFYARGAYFIPAMPDDKEAEYDFYYLDFCLFADARPSRYYVINQKLDVEAGNYGNLFTVIGTYKHKHSVVGPMEYFPRRKSSPVIIKASHSTANIPDHRFFIMFQNEVNGMRALGDVKVKSSALLRKDFGEKEYQLASMKHEDYQNSAYNSLESVIVMPFIFGFTLEELYEVRTPKANARRHAEDLELIELQVREQSRQQGNNNEVEAEQDKLLRIKIEARAFLRSEEGRLLVARQCIRRLMALHSHQIVHGDIKDANIMVEINIQTKSITVKFIDFGFSRKLNDKVSLMPYTGKATGTVAQMAPELLISIIEDKDVFNTIATDEYALGIVLLNVFGDTLVSGFSRGIEAYAKMRCEQDCVQHQLFYKLNYDQSIKNKITSIFNQWLQRNPENRLRLPVIQTMFDQVAEDHYKLKDPTQSVRIEFNHKAALKACEAGAVKISAATHLHYAFAMCVRLKAAIHHLQDNPSAILMFAHTVNIAAFMHLKSKADLCEAVNRYHTAYERSYHDCLATFNKLKRLEGQMNTEPVDKQQDYHAYLEHASLFMRAREQKRCQLDELAIEAEHMTRKSEKMTAAMEDYLRPKL